MAFLSSGTAYIPRYLATIYDYSIASLSTGKIGPIFNIPYGRLITQTARGESHALLHEPCAFDVNCAVVPLISTQLIENLFPTFYNYQFLGFTF